jgi:putative membrane protein
MRTEFQREHFNEALLEAIAKAGNLLAEHFPKKEDGRNELPDEVIEG